VVSLFIYLFSQTVFSRCI